MAYHFRPYAQEQMYLMFPSIRDLVPGGSLARFASDVMDEMKKAGLPATRPKHRGGLWTDGNAWAEPVLASGCAEGQDRVVPVVYHP